MTLPAAVAEQISGVPQSAFLGTSSDGRPHVAPVWYLCTDGALWFFTSGRKLANIEANPRVSLAIEHDGEDGWLAVIRGTATRIDDEETRNEIADELFAQYLGDAEAEAYRDESDEPTGTLLRVDVGSVDFREQ